MKHPWKNRLVISLGLLSGLLYASIEAYLDRHALGKSHLLDIAHDALDWIIPVTLGVLASICIKLYYDQLESNIALSVENNRLKSKLLTHTLASYVLHEIRNPIHNIMAALEKNAQTFNSSDLAIINRNITRLQNLASQLKRMNLLSEDINLRESIFFPDWLYTFINRSFAVLLKRHNIKLETDIVPFKICIHPLLLEQCFMLLFDNALTVLCACPENEPRMIRIRAGRDLTRHGFSVISIENNGSNFPEEVIQAAGNRIVKSAYDGSGIGLVLVRDTLKQVNGDMVLSNQESLASVVLYIPIGDT